VTEQLLLLLGLFVAGWWLRWRGTMTALHVSRLLRFVINFAVPPLIVGALLRASLNRDLLLQPLALMLVMAGVLLTAGVLARAWKLARPRAGAFVVCSGCINLAFSYPLVAAIRGIPGLTQWIIIDIGVTIMTWIGLAYIAASYGGHPGEWRNALRRVLGMAPFWAIVVGFALRGSGLALPAALAVLLQGAGRWMMLLVIPAMGALAASLRRLDRQVVAALALRVGLGTLLAVGMVHLLGITANAQALVIFGGGAPVGFSAVALSQRESLDVEFAGSVTALSILLAVIYLPVVLMLL
jgi:predicted permease